MKMIQAKAILGWGIVAALLLFIVFNLQMTEIGIFGLGLEFPLSLTLVAFTVLGIFVRPAAKTVYSWIRKSN